jgi:glycosyltransferase involved in cell wall biosynthesis
MEIWAHTMVKNEAQWLWYSVSSIVDYIDKILLWDTGSTDQTLEIISELSKKYPGKIEFKERKIADIKDFTKSRQEMLDQTKSDWFLMLDGDEIWWDDSINKVINSIKAQGNEFESVVVPTVNVVGDIFHYQDNGSGRYKFGNKVGHFNLRAINTKIPGLHSQGGHGVWGWADKNGKMIQERNPEKTKFVEAPYLHTSFLQRSGEEKDKDVIKRNKKRKHEIGISFPKDYFYPEVFFRQKPEFVESPWNIMKTSFRTRSFFETPLRKIKRKIWWGKPGY